MNTDLELRGLLVGRERISRIYDAELLEFRKKQLEMGGKVEVMITKAMKSPVESNSEMGERTVVFDHQINQLEVEIDEKCLQVKATRQPPPGTSSL
jgi:phosphate transport system protein